MNKAIYLQSQNYHFYISSISFKIAGGNVLSQGDLIGKKNPCFPRSNIYRTYHLHNLTLLDSFLSLGERSLDPFSLGEIPGCLATNFLDRRSILIRPQRKKQERLLKCDS